MTKKYDLKIDNSKKSEDFNLENKKEKYLPPMDYNSIILIDIENRPKLVRLSWKNDSLRIGIVSKYSDHADLHQELEQFCQLKVINSDAANAADYGIIFEAGYLLSTLQNHPDLSKKKINWVIVSGDKFAGSVERMLQEAGYSCSVAKTRMHLEEYLQ